VEMALCTVVYHWRWARCLANRDVKGKEGRKTERNHSHNEDNDKKPRVVEDPSITA
jgi:hypothetical protein